MNLIRNYDHSSIVIIGEGKYDQRTKILLYRTRRPRDDSYNGLFKRRSHLKLLRKMMESTRRTGRKRERVTHRDLLFYTNPLHTIWLINLGQIFLCEK